MLHGLLDVPADFGAAGAGAAGGAVAQKLLSPRSAVHLADVNVAGGIGAYHVRPVEPAGLAAAAAEAAELGQVLPVDDVDHVVAEVGDVHAALLRVGREIHRTRCAADSLGSDVDFTYKAALARLALRIRAGLSRFRRLEDLHAIVAAIADIEQTVVRQLRAVQGTAEELGERRSAL